jgi:hypothetical protein
MPEARYSRDMGELLEIGVQGVHRNRARGHHQKRVGMTVVKLAPVLPGRFRPRQKESASAAG